jgi:hypothetical protein
MDLRVGGSNRAPRTVLLDTSFVIALENEDDAHHERAKALDSPGGPVA